MTVGGGARMSESIAAGSTADTAEAPTVLIVDDDKDLADTYAMWLPDDYEVEIKYSGVQARKRIGDDLDLVLLDRRMPGIPGDKILEDIRERGIDCLVAMLTAVEPDTDIINLEFDEYLVKPITQKKLRETVDELLLRRGFEPDAQDYFAMESKAAALASRDEENLRDSEAAAELQDEAERATESDRVQELKSQLQRLQRLTSIIREIEKELVVASEREEIERTVCERLVESDPYGLAWVGDYTVSFQQTTPRCLAGADDLNIEEKTVADGGEGPISVAVDTNEVQVVDDFSTDDTAQMLNSLGLSPDEHQISAGAIIPLRYQDTVYGVLNVYTDRQGLFDDREVSVLSELGDSIAHAIHSVETKKLILSDTVVELEFDIDDPADVFVALSQETDSRVELKGFVPASDGELTSYVEVTGTTTEAFIGAATEMPEVQIVRGIGDSTDEHLCELRVAESTIILSLIEAGADVESMYAEEGRGHLTAAVAPEVDVRTVVEAIETRFDDVDLVAKRETERDVQSVGDFRQSLENRLTERQYSVLEAVYSAGYFDWPRESTAKEIANSIDLAPPTLHEHLRGAQKELIETFFDETGKFPEDERLQREE